MADRGTHPVTRRELRIADRDARHPARQLMRAVGSGTRQAGGRHSAGGTVRPPGALRASMLTSSVVQGVTVVVVTAALFGAGAGHLRADQVTAREQQLAAASFEIEREAAHEARLDRALADRLSAQGAAWTQGQRSQAVALAHAAVVTADAVVTASALVVSPEDLSPLGDAVAHLAELLESAPQAAVALATAPAAPVDQTAAAPGEPTAAAAAPTSATPPAAEPLAGAPVDASPDTTLRSAGPTGTASRPVAATPDTAVAATPGTGAAAEPDPVSTTASPTGTVAPRSPFTPADGVPGTGTAPSDAVAEPRTETPTDHLALSAELVAAAATVTVLAAQVQAVADAAIASAEEAARVQAEAEAAALERAHKIAVATDAPNGQIPQDALCAVTFDADAALRCDAAEALEDLNAAFRDRFGTDLRVASSYRSYDAQVATRQARGLLAGAPGTSNHGRGLAVDFSDFGSLGQFDAPAYRWMTANAADHGWYHPDYMEPGGAGPYEPWHWEFGEL